MEASTTVRNMLRDKYIVVPSYQRAYSWETPTKSEERKTQTDVFLSDLEDYNKSKVKSPYYFGHFLFEDNKTYYSVIDGQQRLTSITIFLSALFQRLNMVRMLTDEETMLYEDMVKRRNMIRFCTVDYDRQFFTDYVIDQTRTNTHGIDTVSARRIVNAFKFFKKHLSTQSEEYLTTMLNTLGAAACTTHLVSDESDAIQKFIFQNNRGKAPSNLEIIKAQFMYTVHLHGGEQTETLLREIKGRFETIYQSIASIEYNIDEDDVLLYTLRVHFNSLWEDNALDRINKELSEDNPLPFIKDFTQALTSSFEHLMLFFGRDERAHMDIHSLVTLGGIAVAIPFILKAYCFGFEAGDIGKLCVALGSVVLRHRLIGTRADIRSRLSDVFEAFTDNTPAMQPIMERIELLKTTSDWWWAYWNNAAFEAALQGEIHHPTALYLLWKYEHHLESQGNRGYSPARFERIHRPHLEHIAPVTEPTGPHTYGPYDDDFYNQFLDCLGNYLLLSQSHNCTVGNAPFADKHQTYTYNEQQREIQRLVPAHGVWGKAAIERRKEKIVRFILENF